MCNYVLDNVLAFELAGLSQYAEKAAHFLGVSFKDTRCRMKQNTDYDQLIRGPQSSSSFMVYVNILRYAKSPAWDSDRDNAIVSWAQDSAGQHVCSYISFRRQVCSSFPLSRSLLTVSFPSNHVTFFYSQLLALHVLVKDEEGALQSLGMYFNGKFQEQIVQNGEQV